MGVPHLVDFKKLLGASRISKPIDPIEIFANLDKQSEKGYLRPAQEAVLKEWHAKYRDNKDIIVKLHTGQGKTLISLLMLQSSLNEGKGPALYVCPNNYLVDQIIEQANLFGIKAMKFSGSNPPQPFLNSEIILVTNCNKLFNGKSVFGVRGTRQRESIQIGTLVLDDAHTCLDKIKKSFSITVKRHNDNEALENPIYKELWALFEDSLRRQAAGTCTDIINEEKCLMAVPFWTWHDKANEVLAVLSKYKDSEEILFVWDLIKDHINESICVFSGDRVEISPRLLPVDSIPSFSDTKRRIFVSATLNEDAFLVRDMGIAESSVTTPLSAGDVKYSGERLILLPCLVDSSLQRGTLLAWGKQLASKHNSLGVIALVPSFLKAKGWEEYGADVSDVTNLYAKIDELKGKIAENKSNNLLILVNEYDGVDLPDNICRILFLDSLPSYSTLIDSYLHELRPTSGILRRQLAQRIEQGMGRGIRGYSDWAIVVIVGDDITNFLSEKSKRAFLSKEAQLQIEIGEELVKEMKEEGSRLGPVEKLVNQVLARDQGWKDFYRERMGELKPDAVQAKNLERAKVERDAEILCKLGQFRKASDTIRGILDSSDPSDRGWLFQLMATYLYPIDPAQAMDIQLKAFSENSNLFRPEKGVEYSKLTATGTRATRIIEWLRKHDSYNSAILEVRKITDQLSPGTQSDIFEQAIYELGEVLGFVSERPEKKTGKGPDNLWNIQGKLYWIIECKNEVKDSRDFISKAETGQLSNSIAWFRKNYEDEEGIPILIHPAKELSDNAFIEAFWVLTLQNLYSLRDNAVRLYTSLSKIPFDQLTPDDIAEQLKSSSLDTESLVKNYLIRGDK